MIVMPCQVYPWLQYVKAAILGGLVLYCFAGILLQVTKKISGGQRDRT